MNDRSGNGTGSFKVKIRTNRAKFTNIKNQESRMVCSTDAGLQRYSGNVFTTNNITNSVMTAQCR